MIEVGSIVQVLPHMPNWSGCLVIVTAVRSWGVLGYTPMPPTGGMAFIRLQTDEFAETGGKAVWLEEGAVE